LAEHSLIILPPRLAHSIEAPDGTAREARASPQRPMLRGGMRMIVAGEGDGGVVTACGLIHATCGGTLGLFDHLEEPVVESFGESEPLHDAFRALLDELAAPRAGTRALMEALLKQCLVLLLRRQAGKGGMSAPWLRALEDPRLSFAVVAMLERPAHSFTVEDLARACHLSRSTFAAHFSAAFGQSPIDFLKELRLRRAARLLENTDVSVKTVAQSVGYSSRSYFCRAFKRFHGLDPTRFRAKARREMPRDPDRPREA
jgi:AraC family transcriptional regulator, activator of mtrCDE